MSAVENRLLNWLRNEALPLWDEHGVDRKTGGFFETLQFDARLQQIIADGAIRRGRVAARQIYAFDVGRALGWNSSRSSVVAHGCDYLFTRLHVKEGYFHTSLNAVDGRPVCTFVLYEYAFYLLALARLNSAYSREFPVVATAMQCVQRLRQERRGKNFGFNETAPPTVPLKSNPHMHLLEAALAWAMAADTGVQNIDLWVELAGEIVELCLSRFIDPATGAVREFFDLDWQPLPGSAGVEPGHQYEWAWLLMQWASSKHCSAGSRLACRAAAARLIDVAENFGVDPRHGVVINSLAENLIANDRGAKPWPQCERLKAWSALLQIARTIDETAAARLKIIDAARGLLRFFHGHPNGLWHELMSPDTGFSRGPTKASTFYHIACAIEVLQQALTSPVSRTA